jgi:hypothetical protein
MVVVQGPDVAHPSYIHRWRVFDIRVLRRIFGPKRV